MLLTNPPIGQALAGDALQGGGAVGVAVALRLAGVPTEVKLAAVALQMLFAHAVERANKAALEDGERGFYGVGGDVAARIPCCRGSPIHGS